MLDRQLFSTADINKILQSNETIDKVKIADNAINHPFLIQALTLALDTAVLDTAPQKISFPFKSVFVQDATDLSTSINIRFGARDSFQSKVTLKKKDSMNLGDPISEAWLDWSAQAGKTITLLFFTKANFVSGSLIQQTSGGVQISEGSACAYTNTNLVANTATIVLPANANRILGLLQNLTGADLYLGPTSGVTDPTTAATQGLAIPAGAIFEWRSSAVMYGFSVGGGRVVLLENT